MRVPFVLLAGKNDEKRAMFISAFEKKVAYASIVITDNGKAMLDFLANRNWDDLPSLIILDYFLPDMIAPDLVRELLMNDHYRPIPKVIGLSEINENQIRDCTILGVRDFLKQGQTLIECEGNVRRIDSLLQAELSL